MQSAFAEKVYKKDGRLSRVIIVEHNKLTRIGLRCSLSEYGHIEIAGEAGCARSGVELARECKPDVVLMDLNLAGMCPIEALKTIKRDVPSAKNIMLTNYTNEVSVINAFGAGANAYCIKDIEPEDLGDVIKIVARGGCWIDPAVSEFAFKLFTKQENLPCFHIDKPIEEQIDLTEREIEVLNLIVQGKSNIEISNELFISPHTAKAHVCNILSKFGVNDRVQAAVKAVREHWV